MGKAPNHRAIQPLDLDQLGLDQLGLEDNGWGR